MQVAIIRFPLAKEKVVKRRRVIISLHPNPKDIEDKVVRIELLPPSISNKRR